jgi:hypothetical protein
MGHSAAYTSSRSKIEAGRHDSVVEDDGEDGDAIARASKPPGC